MRLLKIRFLNELSFILCLFGLSYIYQFIVPSGPSFKSNLPNELPSNSSGGKAVLAVEVINHSDTSGDGKEIKETKGKSVPTASAEELSRALTKSFRYNLVRNIHK